MYPNCPRYSAESPNAKNIVRIPNHECAGWMRGEWGNLLLAACMLAQTQSQTTKCSKIRISKNDAKSAAAKPSRGCARSALRRARIHTYTLAPPSPPRLGHPAPLLCSTSTPLSSPMHSSSMCSCALDRGCRLSGNRRIRREAGGPCDTELYMVAVLGS